MSDQLGRRRPLLLVARFLAGTGGGAGAVIARSMVRDLFSGKEAAHAYGVTALVFGVAPVAAPLLGSLLLATAASLPEALPRAARHDAGVLSLFSAFPAVLRDREFLMPALVLGRGFLPLNLYLSMSPFVLQDAYGLSASAFGYLFALNSAGIWLAGRLNLRLVRTVSAYRLLAGSILVSIVASALVAAAALTHAPVVWLFVSGLAGVSPVIMGIAMTAAGLAALVPLLLVPATART